MCVCVCLIDKFTKRKRQQNRFFDVKDFDTHAHRGGGRREERVKITGEVTAGCVISRVSLVYRCSPDRVGVSVEL